VSGLGANECVLSGKWCKSTAFRPFAGSHQRARSSKRAVRLISGVALDQCRVPERYRTRAPFNIPEREVDQATSFVPRNKSVEETDRGCFLSLAEPNQQRALARGQRRQERRQCCVSPAASTISACKH